MADKLKARERAEWTISLVVASEGASPAEGKFPAAEEQSHAIERSDLVARNVARELSALTGHETFPVVPGPLVKGAALTAVDRQLGMGFGAAAARALSNEEKGVMVSFHPPDLLFVPLAEAVNKVRTVPLKSEFMLAARSMGIAMGDEE